MQVAVPTAEEHRKGSPEPGAAGFVAERAEQYFDHGSSYSAVAAAAAVEEEAAAPTADEVPAAGWEWEHIPAVPIAAARVAAVVVVVPTAVVLQEEHSEVPGSVPIAAVQAGEQGTGQAEAGSTAAVSLAQAATEQLVPG